PDYLQFEGPIPMSFIDSRIGKKVRLHASIDLLSFRQVESQTIAFGVKSSRIIPGLQCNMDPPSEEKKYQESRCEVLYGSEIGYVNILPAETAEPSEPFEITPLQLNWGNSQYFFENPNSQSWGGFNMDPIAEYSRNWLKPAPMEYRVLTA